MSFNRAGFLILALMLSPVGLALADEMPGLTGRTSLGDPGISELLADISRVSAETNELFSLLEKERREAARVEMERDEAALQCPECALMAARDQEVAEPVLADFIIGGLQARSSASPRDEGRSSEPRKPEPRAEPKPKTTPRFGIKAITIPGGTLLVNSSRRASDILATLDKELNVIRDRCFKASDVPLCSLEDALLSVAQVSEKFSTVLDRMNVPQTEKSAVISRIEKEYTRLNEAADAEDQGEVEGVLAEGARAF